MKKCRITNNLGLKIIALIFSAFLWLIVVNFDNPVTGETYSNIPVTIVNDDIITSAGDVYQVVGEQTVSVVVYASRQVQQEIHREDIVATADIRDMDTSTGLVPVKIQIPDYAGDYESAESIPPNIQIQREKSGKKVLSLIVDTDDTTPAEGYMLGDMTVRPETVTITGAESTLEQIDRAVAQIDIGDITEDTQVTADLILYDVYGNVVSQGQLENNLGEDGITVSVEVLEMKTVPVEVEVSGTPAEGYEYTGSRIEPESVQICGKSDALKEVESIRIPASVIDISDASEPLERTIDITQYLPDGVSLTDDNAKNITITAMIEESGTRTIDFLVSSIKINNLAENLQVSYEPDAEIRFRFSGEQNVLETLDISNAVSVDMSECTTPGTYTLPVKVDVPDGITLTENVTVRLTVEEKQEEEQNGAENTG